MTKAEAEQAATNAGLQLEVTEEFSSDVEAGKVISQEPQFVDGYLVKDGSTVKIVISKGGKYKDCT